MVGCGMRMYTVLPLQPIIKDVWASGAKAIILPIDVLKQKVFLNVGQKKIFIF